MAKKITTHSGRKTKNGVYSSRHNDRNFDLENAKHIDPEKTKDNFYYNFLSDKYYMEEDKKNYETFKESEDNFYQNNFSNWLNTRNEKHKKSRHKERIKKMKDLQKMERYAPEEVIFQIGNKNNNDEIDNEIFWEAMSDYLEWFDNEYGENVKLLNCGYHVDETTPHFHIRQVFMAHDENGDLMPNQTKALEELGIQRPDPTKKKSRYNNPKMTFTERNRKKLIEICEEKGLEIDTEVENPSQKHKDLLEYKTQKLQEERDSLNQNNYNLRAENIDLIKNNSNLKKENKNLKNEKLNLELENRHFKDKNKKLEEENKKINRENIEISTKFNNLQKQYNEENAKRQQFRAVLDLVNKYNKTLDAYDNPPVQFIKKKGLMPEFKRSYQRKDVFEENRKMKKEAKKRLNLNLIEDEEKGNDGLEL
jgi:hypothetical protein